MKKNGDHSDRQGWREYIKRTSIALSIEAKKKLLDNKRSGVSGIKSMESVLNWLNSKFSILHIEMNNLFKPELIHNLGHEVIESQKKRKQDSDYSQDKTNYEIDGVEKFSTIENQNHNVGKLLLFCIGVGFAFYVFDFDVNFIASAFRHYTGSLVSGRKIAFGIALVVAIIANLAPFQIAKIPSRYRFLRFICTIMLIGLLGYLIKCIGDMAQIQNAVVFGKQINQNWFYVINIAIYSAEYFISGVILVPNYTYVNQSFNWLAKRVKIRWQKISIRWNAKNQSQQDANDKELLTSYHSDLIDAKDSSELTSAEYNANCKEIVIECYRLNNDIPDGYKPKIEDLQVF